MFFRLKPSGSRTYLQIVENRRENGARSPARHRHPRPRSTSSPPRGSAGQPCSPPAPAYCDQILAAVRPRAGSEDSCRPLQRLPPRRPAAVRAAVGRTSAIESVIERACSPGAASSSRSSGPCSPACCTACSCRARTGPARSGCRTTSFPGMRRTWSCITSIAPWRGSARNWTPQSAQAHAHAGRPALRQGPDRGGAVRAPAATCSASSPSCFLYTRRTARCAGWHWPGPSSRRAPPCPAGAGPSRGPAAAPGRTAPRSAAGSAAGTRRWCRGPDGRSQR